MGLQPSCLSEKGNRHGCAKLSERRLIINASAEQRYCMHLGVLFFAKGFCQSTLKSSARLHTHASVRTRHSPSSIPSLLNKTGCQQTFPFSVISLQPFLDRHTHTPSHAPSPVTTTGRQQIVLSLSGTQITPILTHIKLLTDRHRVTDRHINTYSPKTGWQWNLLFLVISSHPFSLSLSHTHTQYLTYSTTTEQAGSGTSSFQCSLHIRFHTDRESITSLIIIEQNRLVVELSLLTISSHPHPHTVPHLLHHH